MLDRWIDGGVEGWRDGGTEASIFITLMNVWSLAVVVGSKCVWTISEEVGGGFDICVLVSLLICCDVLWRKEKKGSASFKA